MIVPIIFPIHDTPVTCPNCKQDENKKEVCKNCSYEYKYGGGSCLEYLFILFIILLFLWQVFVILVSFMGLGFNYCYGSDPTCDMNFFQLWWYYTTWIFKLNWI